MSELGKWVRILIDHHCTDPDYSDADEVQGWLGATLKDDVLTVVYESGDSHDSVEKYRLVPVE
jgi:hypothetical protein